MSKLSKLKDCSVADCISLASLKGINLLLKFLWTPWVRLKMSLSGVHFGKGISCWGNVLLLRGRRSTITLGNNVSIISSSHRCTSGTIFAPTKFRTAAPSARIIIGDNVGLNGTSITARSRTIRIGERTIIAPNVTIMDSDFHDLWPPEAKHGFHGLENDRDVTIGNDVWIGTQAIILKGVTIGHNAVIGARSLVNSDIPDNALAAGTPARVIRMLNSTPGSIHSNQN